MKPFLQLPDGEQIPVRDGMVLGRTQCDVVIDDTKASRRHARVISQGGVIEIEDLGSSNGTFLNGKKVKRKLLRPGDEVQIGKTVVVLVEHSEAVPAADDDDVDLFGDDFAGPDEDTKVQAIEPIQVEDLPTSAPPPRPAVVNPEPVRVSIPPPDVREEIEAKIRAEDAAAREAQAETPPASRPKHEVLEFEDEVIEVAVRPKEDLVRASVADDGEPIIAAKKDRVLQFQRKDARGGLLGDDLAQMGGLQKVVLLAAVIALACVVAYVAMELVAG